MRLLPWASPRLICCDVVVCSDPLVVKPCRPHPWRHSQHEGPEKREASRQGQCVYFRAPSKQFEPPNGIISFQDTKMFALPSPPTREGAENVAGLRALVSSAVFLGHLGRFGVFLGTHSGRPAWKAKPDLLCQSQCQGRLRGTRGGRLGRAQRFHTWNSFSPWRFTTGSPYR